MSATNNKFVSLIQIDQSFLHRPYLLTFEFETINYWVPYYYLRYTMVQLNNFYTTSTAVPPVINGTVLFSSFFPHSLRSHSLIINNISLPSTPCSLSLSLGTTIKIPHTYTTIVAHRNALPFVGAPHNTSHVA